MDFRFSEEQRAFQGTVRDLLEKECPPGAVRAAWSSAAGRVPGLWARLAGLGVVGLTVPEAHGGLGLDELDLVLLLEEAGRAALPEPLLETTAVGAPLLAEAGGAELAARWLPRVAAGEAILAVGLASSPFVLGADSADLLLLERDGELHAIAKGAARLEAHASVDGARRPFTVSWEPRPETRFASGAAARAAIAAASDRATLAAAAELCGLGRRMLDVTVEYVKVRRQFGKSVGSFQAVKHHLADALIQLEFARPLVHRAACSIARGDAERSVHASMAKSFASDAAALAARAALQCHGAIGYSFEHDLHLWMKRTWALAAAHGDAASHRARVAAAILDGPREGGA